jgi:glycine cleavage system H protein
VGITDHAQEQLGDIVFVALPEVGATVTAGEPCGELESTKSVSDLYAPVSGVVAARNEAVVTAPELINSDPYDKGWMFEVTPADPAAVGELLSAGEYAAGLEG